MKNLILVGIIGLVFSCGGEQKSTANTSKTPIKTIENTNKIKETSSAMVAEIKTTANETATAVQTSVATPVKEKIASTPAKIVEKTPAINKENPVTNVPSEKVGDPNKEEPKKAMALANQKMEEEKRMMEAAKQKEAQARAKAELAAKIAEAEKKKATEAVETKTPGTVFNHNVFNVLLQKHVSSTGKVNYNGFKNDEAKLDGYLSSLEAQTVESGWSKNKKLAFWINAYNAYTIKLILKNHPVKKITDLHGGKPWDVKWIKLNGKTLSLNNIENDIIRPQFKEPRIHFAVNCAAKSCPPLLNRAWSPATMEKNFERQAKAFINNSTYNSISENSVEVSKIFEWYGEDFGSLINYLNKYSNTKIAAGTKINYKEYNWNLNK